MGPSDPVPPNYFVLCPPDYVTIEQSGCSYTLWARFCRVSPLEVVIIQVLVTGGCLRNAGSQYGLPVFVVSHLALLPVKGKSLIGPCCQTPSKSM